MFDVENFLNEANSNLTNQKYKLDIVKFDNSYKHYNDVLSLPYYSENNKKNNYEFGCIIPFMGRHTIVKLNVESLNKQTIKPAIILTCSNIPDYNFAKSLELIYDNVFVNVSVNYPLGKKFYDSVKFAQTLDNLKYLMILGSDDLLSINYIETTIDEIKNGYDLVGSRKWLVYTNEKKLYKLSYKKVVDILLGGGKTYTKKFLDSVNWEIFDQYRPIHLDEHGEYLFNTTDLKKSTLNGDEFILSIKGDWECLNTKDKLLSANNRLNIEDASEDLINVTNEFNIYNDDKIFKVDKPKLCILTTLYLRHNLNKIILDYYNSMKKALSNICDITLIACGSYDDENEKIAKENGFIYLNYPNAPLTQKHNTLFVESKKYNPDFNILIGSDDFICENVIYTYINYYNIGIDYSGILDFKCIDNAGYWYWGGYTVGRIGEPVGGGRYFSKRLLNELHWTPWGNMKSNRNLDGISNNLISKLNKPMLKKTISCVTDNVNLITIRSEINITDMSVINDRIIISNPLNDLVIDKNGPINNIILPYNSNILSDLNPRKNYDKYEEKNEITLSEMVKTEKPNTKLIELSEINKKKVNIKNVKLTNLPEELKIEPTDKPVINSVVHINKEKLYVPENKKTENNKINTTNKTAISKISESLSVGKLRKQKLRFGKR